MTSDSPRPLRIAQLAPPFVPIPPPAYGGVERSERLYQRLADERRSVQSAA